MIPAARDPFIDLVALLHQNTKGRRWMACLQLYLDESGHVSTHPFVVVAGFMATEESWAGFADAWNGILYEHHVEPPFHMTDFEAKEDQFAEREWRNEEKRRALFGSLMNEITSRPLVMIGAAHSVERFRAVDWSTCPEYEPIKDPYLWVMQDVLRRAVDASSDPDLPECNGDRIATVLARQKNADIKRGKDPKGAADAYYKATAIIAGQGKLVNAATFGDQKEFPQLQAADIAAFELRWKLTRPDLHRFPWQQITNTRRLVVGLKGIKIDPLLLFPPEKSLDYHLTVSRRKRPVDVIMRAKESKAQKNQGRRTHRKR